MTIQSSFLTELVCYLIVFPAAGLCYFPMKNQLRVNRRKTIQFSVILLGLLIPLVALIDTSLNLSYQALFIPLLALWFILYKITLKTSFNQALCVFLTICALFGFLSNYANGIDAILHPTSTVDQFSLEAALIQLGFGFLAFGLFAFPLSRYGSRLIDRLDLPPVWNLASLISALFLVFNLLIVPRRYELLRSGRLFLIFWSIVSLNFLLFLLLFVLFYFIVSGLLSRSELNARNRLLEMQEAQYQAQMKYIEATSRERHDFRHALRTIESLVQSGNYAGIQAFVSEYVGSMPQNTYIRYCSSPSVNAALNHYRQLAEENRIRTAWEISLPEYTDIPDVDLCSILGNYLDNAISACSRLPEQDRWIRLSILSRHSYFLYIVASNSFSGHVRFRDNRYLSTRRNGTGLGLASILACAERNGGTAQFSHQGNIFYTDIMIPLRKEQPGTDS